MGPGPRRSAFEEVLWSLTKEPNMWKLLGGWYVPDVSPVCDEQRWESIGSLLALALLTIGSIQPVSPALIYALLVTTFHTPKLADPQMMMHLSLEYIKEIDELQADVILPWMVLPPGQNWKDLPAAHRTELLLTLTGLGVDVSLSLTSLGEEDSKVVWQAGKVSSLKASDHESWSAVIATSALLGQESFFRVREFQALSMGFKQTMWGQDEWSQVRQPAPFSAACMHTLNDGQGCRVITWMWCNSLGTLKHPYPQG